MVKETTMRTFVLLYMLIWCCVRVVIVLHIIKGHLRVLWNLLRLTQATNDHYMCVFLRKSNGLLRKRREHSKWCDVNTKE